MNREEMHKTVDELFDRLEAARSKTAAGLDVAREKAAIGIGAAKDMAAAGLDIARNKAAVKDQKVDLDEARLTAEAARDSLKRAACRSRGWLQSGLTDLQLEADDVQEKLTSARAAHDKSASQKAVEGAEKYAEDMLKLAQDVADDAADAALDAVNARKDFEDKFSEEKK